MHLGRSRLLGGVGLAIVAFALGFWLGWDAEGESTHWGAIVTSAGAVVAAVGVVFVWQSVRQGEQARAEAEKTRHATTAADISRRWDEPEMRASRELIRRKARNGTLSAYFIAEGERDVDDDETTDFMVLQVVPNYLEDVVILLKLESLDAVFVEESLGNVLRTQWEMWHDAATGWAAVEGRDPWPNWRTFCGEPPWSP